MNRNGHALPAEVRGWNWGAFTLNIFWGVGNKSYLPLLCLVPIFNIFWIFVCGIKGNAWAWKKGNYQATPHDIKRFNTIQRTWQRAGIITLLLWIMLIIVTLFSIIFIASEAATRTNNQASVASTKVQADSDPYEKQDAQVNHKNESGVEQAKFNQLMTAYDNLNYHLQTINTQLNSMSEEQKDDAIINLYQEFTALNDLQNSMLDELSYSQTMRLSNKSTNILKKYEHVFKQLDSDYES